MAHHVLMADGKGLQERSKVSSSKRVVLVCSERLTKEKGKKPVLNGKVPCQAQVVLALAKGDKPWKVVEKSSVLGHVSCGGFGKPTGKIAMQLWRAAIPKP